MGQIFRIKDILYGIRKHLSVIIATTVCGMIVGALIFAVNYFSASGTVSYEIYASFSVSMVNSDGIFTNGTDSPSMSDFELADQMMPAIIYVCRSEKVCNAVIDRLQLVGVTVKSIQRSLSLSQEDETSVVTVMLSWADSAEGVRILEAVLEELPSAMQEVFTIGTINTIEPPVAVEVTSSASKSSVVMMTGLGFLVGMLYCFSQLYLHPTLIEIKDINELFGLDVLTDISNDPAYPNYLQDNLITNREDLSAPFRESYTALAHILLHQMEADHFSLFVTSAARGEGKTTAVANLGLELAALDKRVLMIDFDLASPTLGSCFLDKIDYRNTVNAVYFDENSAKNAIIKINENLSLLPACLDKRHIGINRFAKKLVSQLEESYDVILMDTEPVGESSEMLYFSNVSNSALFVIRYDYTPCDDIEDSVEKLRKTNTDILGAVVNRVVHMSLGLPGAGETDRDLGKDEKPKKLKKKSKEKQKAEQEPERKQKKARREKTAKRSMTVTAAEEEDDSDLADDDALTALLRELEGGEDRPRREHAAPSDDEFDETDPGTEDMTPPAGRAVRKPEAKKAGRTAGARVSAGAAGTGKEAKSAGSRSAGADRSAKAPRGAAADAEKKPEGRKIAVKRPAAAVPAEQETRKRGAAAPSAAHTAERTPEVWDLPREADDDDWGGEAPEETGARSAPGAYNDWEDDGI